MNYVTQPIVVNAYPLNMLPLLRRDGFMSALRLILALAFGLFSAGSALAEKRVALVIGNSAYKSVARLSNPANDAAAIAAMLKDAGFDSVESKLNTPALELRKTLREFGSKTREADVAVIYYAGHGIELDGANYLIPIDATLETDADLLDEAVALERVLFAVEPAKQLRLIILDACRDNPFAKTMKRTIASRAVGRGLAKVEPTSPNTLIAFAAKAGSTASDGDVKHSPYSTALVEHLPKPGLDVRRALGFVRDDVLKSTGNKQEPYVYGSLGGNDVPLVPAKPVVAPGPQADPHSSIRKDYELALQLGTRDAWEAFLRTYPAGFYADLAKAQLRKVSAEEERVAAAEKARLAEHEKARLAAEGGREAEQAKAAAAAKAAEAARIAAEKTKQIEQEKAAAAERVRLAEQEKTRLEAEKAAQAAEEKKQLAALQPSPGAKPSALELTTSLQLELRRVGCLSASATGEWTSLSERSLALFNKHAGTRFEIKAASLDALDAVKAKTGRVCPLTCDRGYRTDGDRCVRITCRSGYRLNEDDECERIEPKKPTVSREQQKPTVAPARSEASPSKPQATGQIYCSNTGPCRPVRPGCRLETGGTNLTGFQREVCR